MKVTERIKEAWHGLRGHRVKEAEVGVGIDSDEHLYRRLTGGTERDLSPLKHDRALDIAHYLFLTNPIARRLTEDLKDWVIGEGIIVRHKNPRLQEVLDRHWIDPINNWPLAQHTFVRELGLFGELCLPVFVNKADGHVRLGVLDPSSIKSVEPNPENVRIPVRVHKKNRKGKTSYRVIHVDEDPRSKTYGRLIGEVLFYAIGNVSHATRGTPDLLALADFLDAYDQFLFDDMERTVLAKRIVYDLLVKGADEETLRKKAAAFKGLRPGGIYAHNAEEEVNAVTPDLGAQDASTAAELWRRHIMGGAGWPDSLFGAGGGEFGEEVAKRIKSRQQFVRHMMEDIFRFVLDQWWIANPELRKDILKDLAADKRSAVNAALHDFEVTMPELTDVDLARVSDSVLKVTQAVVLARTGDDDGAFLTHDEGRKAIAAVMGHLGVEISPSDDEEALKTKLEDGLKKAEGTMDPKKIAILKEALNLVSGSGNGERVHA